MDMTFGDLEVGDIIYTAIKTQEHPEKHKVTGFKFDEKGGVEICCEDIWPFGITLPEDQGILIIPSGELVFIDPGYCEFYEVFWKAKHEKV